MVGGSGTVMSAVSGVSSSSGSSSGQPTPIALVPNVIDSLSRLSSSQVNNILEGGIRKVNLFIYI